MKDTMSDFIPCERFLGLEHADPEYRIGELIYVSSRNDRYEDLRLYVSDIRWNALESEWRYSISFADGRCFASDIPSKHFQSKFRMKVEQLRLSLKTQWASLIGRL
jgi:hypothetical protein